MSDLSMRQLPLDQQTLVRQVAARLAPDYQGTFGPETVERFVLDSVERLLPTAKVTVHLENGSEVVGELKRVTLEELDEDEEDA